MITDPLKNVMIINLTDKTFEVQKRPELFQKYLGGTGVAINLLKEFVPPLTDPLGEQNAIIFSTGPLVGAFPMASKAVAMFKSPLTGNLGESHAGGRTATAIRSAGLGAIVIHGKSSMPIYLVVDGHMVYFRDARTMWGMKSTRDPRYAIARREKGSGFRTILVNGLAGEKMVSFASIVSETYRHFGRLGLGAVFGSKKLKAIQIGGKYAIPVVNRSSYRKTVPKIMERCMEPKFIAKYRELGTAVNVMSLNEIGSLPTRNLQETSFKEAVNISGETLQTKFLARRIACSFCPVACVHLAALKEKFSPESFFNKTTLVSYDYELIYALGSMLGVGDTNEMLRLLVEVENLGMDAISAGATLSWTCEAYEKGIISPDHTLIELGWGKTNSFITILRYICSQPNDFYQALAKGSEYAAELFGGKELLTTYGKVEMAGYHTGPAQILGFLMGTRHSHLDSGPYSFDQECIAKHKTPFNKDIINYIINEESWRQVLTSLVICLFARKVYDDPTVLECLSEMGYQFNMESLKTLGLEIYLMKIQYKIDCGYDFLKNNPSKRIFETKTAMGHIDPSYFLILQTEFTDYIIKLLEQQKNFT